ncbi:MAG: hypothetical protein JSV56_09500 [Methanomassiliicoccales archaeon]|nr:MAG: hypothetical protein JSV56_09500 [Methanomassiliicoccales archaeon]
MVEWEAGILEKNVLYRWVGVILIILGLFSVILNTIMLFTGGITDIYLWLGIGFCTAFGLIPGIILFIWGWKLAKEKSELTKLAAYLRSYRRIKVSDVARAMEKNEYETEQLILQCVEKNLINGYFDRNTREFFTRESQLGEVKTPDSCPNCGAFFESKVLSGETAICKFCGSKFSPDSSARSEGSPQPPQTGS